MASPRHLGQDSSIDELGYVECCCPVSHPEYALRARQGERRHCEQRVDECGQQTGSARGSHPLAVVITQLLQAGGAPGRICCLSGDSIEKEVEPRSPFTMRGHSQEQLVVSISTWLNVCGQIQKRTWQQTPLDEQRSHE